MNKCVLSRQRGQSTVEFVTLSFVLVPLLLIVPLIGKYMDIAQTTAVASRYVAFEGTVRHSSSADSWKSDADLAQEVRRRFFGNSDAPIKTGDTAGDFNAHRNALWFDHRGAPLLPAFDKNVGVNTTVQSLSHPVGATYAEKLGLSYRNFYTGQVNVGIADIAGVVPFDTIGLSLNRSTTVLADSWAASGPAVVQSRIKSSPADPLGPFPYQPLELAALPITPLIVLFEQLPGGTPPPKIGWFSPDRVPSDRLAK
jgi:hypothetical protein